MENVGSDEGYETWTDSLTESGVGPEICDARDLDPTGYSYRGHGGVGESACASYNAVNISFGRQSR